MTKLGKSKSKLILFLDEVFVACTKHNAAFTAVGMPATMIPSIDAMRISLLEANTNQKAFIKVRHVATNECIETFNDLYRTIAQIIRAAQIVYRGNEAKQGMFVFRKLKIKKEELRQEEKLRIKKWEPRGKITIDEWRIENPEEELRNQNDESRIANWGSEKTWMNNERYPFLFSRMGMDNPFRLKSCLNASNRKERI